MKFLATTLGIALVAAALTSCSREDILESKVIWSVTPENEEACILSSYASFESVTVRLDGPGRDTRAVVISTDSDWLTVVSDTLTTDSIVAFKTTENIGQSRRTATLKFTNIDNPEQSARLNLEQLSAADNDSNGNDPRSQMYVCYGYDIYKSLEDEMAVRTKEPVLSLEGLRARSVSSKYEIVQDSHLSRTDTRYVASNDIHAFGKDLTLQQTRDYGNQMEGCRENCVNAEQLILEANGTLEQQNIGHGSLEKAVAARVVDRGALIDLQRSGNLPFSDAFSTRLWAVRSSSGQQREKLIEKILNDYGTHVVIQADLGGRIDYTFTMSKVAAFNSVEEMEKEIEYTLGRVSASERTGPVPSSTKSKDGAITVKGGSYETRVRLMADIRALGGSGQITPSHITDWLASINYSDSPETDPNLEVIHFELMPLWDLVDDELRNDFRNVTFKLLQRSDNALPASFTGTDIYEFTPSQENDLFDFSSAGDDDSLCRLLYFDGEPVLQVCSEYVPKIRTDSRVTVVYPIYKQLIRLNQGLFIGDGIHQPAYLGFKGDFCYVNPISDLEPGTILEHFYYTNGNLLLFNPTNVAGLTGKSRTVRDDVFSYMTEGYTIDHPLVKLGAKFWTRHDITHSMGFADNPDARKRKTNEHIENGILYGRFDLDIGYYARKDNGWTWGYAPNTYYEDNPNTLWYMPKAVDVAELYAFLGFNPKALFPGQVSGFNARFNGYYGLHDIINSSSFSDASKKVRYKGQYQFFATRNDDNVADAILLILGSDYTIESRAALGDWHTDYYPMRAVRGYMFIYPKLQTIKERTYYE